MPLGRLYTLGIDFRIGRAHSAALLPEVLGLVADGRLRPSEVTTVVAGWDDAAERFTEPALKLVVAREVEGEAAPVTSSDGTVA
jgi:alcohol dehydrogenase